MASDFQNGDSVTWNSPQGETEGIVEKKLTAPAKIMGYAVKASDDNPGYLVKADKSGKEAAYKPDELKKRTH